jgi:hypothetical protein
LLPAGEAVSSVGNDADITCSRVNGDCANKGFQQMNSKPASIMLGGILRDFMLLTVKDGGELQPQNTNNLEFMP